MFARIFGRRHKQTTFLDAGFHGILRVKVLSERQTGHPDQTDPFEAV